MALVRQDKFGRYVMAAKQYFRPETSADHEGQQLDLGVEPGDTVSLRPIGKGTALVKYDVGEHERESIWFSHGDYVWGESGHTGHSSEDCWNPAQKYKTLVRPEKSQGRSGTQTGSEDTKANRIDIDAMEETEELIGAERLCFPEVPDEPTCPPPPPNIPITDIVGKTLRITVDIKLEIL